MLTLPDFKEKKIVIVGNKDGITNNLKFHNSNIRLYKKDKFIDQVSCHSIICLFIIGDTTITTKLIKKLKEYGVSIFFLTRNLKLYAEMFSTAEGNYLLRQKQYQLSESKNLDLSKFIIKNKINNQMVVLRQESKLNYKKEFDQIIKNIEDTSNRQTLLGLEGNASNIYFKNIFKNYDWLRRAPQIKEDPTNLLLDVGYTLIFNFIDSIIHLFGFDSYKGFYHQLFFERKSLSCDLMEPVRPLIDKCILKMFHLKQINDKDFILQNGSFKFKEYPSANKYISNLAEEVLKQKESIYQYIYSFYRYIQNSEKYKFIPFKIK
jgi:CRISPR-associated protein Cas1